MWEVYRSAVEGVDQVVLAMLQLMTEVEVVPDATQAVALEMVMAVMKAKAAMALKAIAAKQMKLATAMVAVAKMTVGLLFSVMMQEWH
jgi:hypothetical protein